MTVPIIGEKKAEGAIGRPDLSADLKRITGFGGRFMEPPAQRLAFGKGGRLLSIGKPKPAAMAPQPKAMQVPKRDVWKVTLLAKALILMTKLRVIDQAKALGIIGNYHASKLRRV